MPDLSDAMRDINARVNRDTRYRADPKGVDDWTIGWTEGDCEDFAAKKMELLRGEYGIAAPMRVGVFHRPGDDKAQAAWHAVLLVDGDDGRRYALDNLSDEPYEWTGQTATEWEPGAKGWQMTRMGGQDISAMQHFRQAGVTQATRDMLGDGP